MLTRRASLAALLAGPLPALPAMAGDDLLEVAGSRLQLRIAPPPEPLRNALAGWIESAARAVAGYFGRFPVPEVELAVEWIDGREVPHGQTVADAPPRLRLQLGRALTPAQLRDDWVLVHEMVHLAVPRVARAHNWLHEGIATYVEGVARARAGLITPRRLWIDLSLQLPQGLPRPGEGGLDDTTTWARTYWGGALFCLLADVRMRQRSANRAGLQQALQGLLAAGGSYAQRWPIERVLGSADGAVGQDTLAELYAQMKQAPYPVDLGALWRDLGVAGTALRDDAPLAAIRRAISAA